MNILHVTAQKPDSTGSGVYLTQLVGALGRLGCRQAVVCGIGPDDTVDLPCEVSTYPVRFETPELPFPVCGMSDVMPYKATRYCDMSAQMVGQFCTAFSQCLQQAVEELQPDLILCNHLYLVTALTRELFPHIPVAAICHSTCLRQLQKHGLERERIMEAIRGLNYVFALQEAQARSISQLFDLPVNRISLLGTGYDAQVFCGAGEPQPAKRGTRLIFAGKIAYAKGVASLIRALGRLEGSASDWELRLAGGAGNLDEYERIQGLAKECPVDVHFLGKLTPQDLADEYRAADIFVLPSFYEGLPLVTLEALACGCKVVMSDLEGAHLWLDAVLPEVAVEYVPLPRMEEVDKPYEDDLAAFEHALAQALQRSAAAAPVNVDVSALSWDGLAKRLLDTLNA